MRQATTMYSYPRTFNLLDASQLQRLDTAAVLEHVKESLDLPARPVPVNHACGALQRAHRQVGQQTPLDGLFTCKGAPSPAPYVESQQHWLIEVPEHLKRATHYWAKLQTFAMVRRTRQVGEKTSEEIHYYLSSLPLSAGINTVAHAVRNHWAVENQLHWSLDVSFGARPFPWRSSG